MVRIEIDLSLLYSSNYFQMFNFKLKVSDARKAWIKSPEALDNCSIGFCFPHNSEEKALVSVAAVGPINRLKFFTC